MQKLHVRKGHKVDGGRVNDSLAGVVTKITQQSTSHPVDSLLPIPTIGMLRHDGVVPHDGSDLGLGKEELALMFVDDVNKFGVCAFVVGVGPEPLDVPRDVVKPCVQVCRPSLAAVPDDDGFFALLARHAHGTSGWRQVLGEAAGGVAD